MTQNEIQIVIEKAKITKELLQKGPTAVFLARRGKRHCMTLYIEADKLIAKEKRLFGKKFPFPLDELFFSTSERES